MAADHPTPEETPMHPSPPATAPADMTDPELLVEMMVADAAVSTDGSDAAADRQTAAFAAAAARWGIDATERTAQWAVTHHSSGTDLIRTAKATPDTLFAIMRGEPCRCGVSPVPH